MTCRWSCDSSESVEKFSSRYNYYDGLKHEAGYLYPPSQTVLAGWKHTGRSRETLAGRSSRATSPLISRELDRSAGFSTNQRKKCFYYFFYVALALEADSFRLDRTDICVIIP